MAGSQTLGSLRAKSVNYLILLLVGRDAREPLSTRWLVSLSIWLAVLIATPISIWLGSERLFPALASLGVAAQVVTSIVALTYRWTFRQIAASSSAVFALTWLIEWIGSTTGIPFGSYHYTGALQPQFLGVPLLIPFAWLMMLIPAWGTTSLLLTRWKANLGSSYTWVFSALSGLVFTAWDLYLDPQMVERGLWTWDQAGAYFGIPLSNYTGWWLAAFVITRLVKPTRLPDRPLLVIYSLTWLFQAVGLGILWRQPGPALTGFIGMGVFATLAWQQVWISSHRQSSAS